MHSIGKKSEVGNSGSMAKLANPHMFEDRLPPAPTSRGEVLICGYDQGPGETLFVCDEPDDARILLEEYDKGDALMIGWYHAPRPVDAGFRFRIPDRPESPPVPRAPRSAPTVPGGGAAGRLDDDRALPPEYAAFYAEAASRGLGRELATGSSVTARAFSFIPGINKERGLPALACEITHLVVVGDGSGGKAAALRISGLEFVALASGAVASAMDWEGFLDRNAPAGSPAFGR